MSALASVLGTVAPRSAEGAAAHGASADVDERPLPWWAWILIVAGAVALVVGRRPDALTMPQFYAEDGKWFSDAYNYGWLPTIVWPYADSLQVTQRLGAAISQPFGPLWAPLVFNVIAIGFQVAPALYLVSMRCRNIAPFGARVVLALAYLLISNSEINANLTNVGWHLVLLALIVMAAAPARAPLGSVIDGAALVLTWLTGPFCLFLLFPALLLHWFVRSRRSLVIAAGTALACVLAVVTTITGHRPPPQPLAASGTGFADIVSVRVFHWAVTGGDVTLAGAYLGHRSVAFAVTAACIVLGCWALLRGPWALRALLILAAGELVTALVSTGIPWPFYLAPYWDGLRYFFVPDVALVALLFWAITRVAVGRARLAIAAVAVGAFLAASAIHFAYPPFPDLGYPAQVKAFESLPAGTPMHFRIVPTAGAPMLLVKH